MILKVFSNLNCSMILWFMYKAFLTFDLPSDSAADIHVALLILAFKVS